MPDGHLLSVSFGAKNEETTYLKGVLSDSRVIVNDSETYEMRPGGGTNQLTHKQFVDYILKGKLRDASHHQGPVFLSIEVTRSSSVVHELINFEDADPVTVFITDDLAVKEIDKEDYEVPEKCYGVPETDMNMMIELAYQTSLTIKPIKSTLKELKKKVESGSLDYSDPACAALGAMCWYARHLKKKGEL